MNFFIFSYVQTALTECVALESTAPVALVGDAQPSAAGTPPAVAGNIFWNAFDSSNGNSFVWDSRKICLIANSDATHSVDVTFATVNGTINGFTRTVQDLVVRVDAGELAVIPNLPALFRDGTLVKLSIAEVSGGTAITDCKIAVVKIT